MPVTERADEADDHIFRSKPQLKAKLGSAAMGVEPIGVHGVWIDENSARGNAGFDELLFESV